MLSANHPAEYKLYQDEYTAKLRQRQELIDSYKGKQTSRKGKSKRRVHQISDSSDSSASDAGFEKWTDDELEQRKLDSVIGYWLAAVGLPSTIMDLPDTHLLFEKVQPKLNIRLGTEYSSTKLLNVYQNMKDEIKKLVKDAETDVQGNLCVELQTSARGRKLLVLKLQMADSDFVYHNLTLDVVELARVPTIDQIAAGFDGILQEYKDCFHQNCRFVVTYRTSNEVPDAVVLNRMVMKAWYDGVSRIERAFNHGCSKSEVVNQMVMCLGQLNKVINTNEVIRGHLEEICSMQAGESLTY